MKTIIAALDYSDVTDRVVEVSVGLAKAFEATLHLVHMLDPGPNYAIYGFSPAEFPINPMNDRIRTASDSRLHDLATSTGLDKSRVVTASVVGTPVDGILQYAEDQRADLIVLGAHSRGFLGSMLVGSVAQGIIRRAELPTLIVPGKS
jgi:nucleotide-binding universal stress UspA family protein